MKNWPVSTVHNCLDTKIWKPIKKEIARDALGLPQKDKILLFGSYGGNNSYNKGKDLLEESIKALHLESKDFHLAIFGETSNIKPFANLFPVHNFAIYMTMSA